MLPTSLNARPETLNFGFSCESGFQAPFHRLHRHDEIELGLCEFGCVDALVGRTRLLCRPGRLIVFWATQPHGPLMVEPGTMSHVIHLPFSSLHCVGMPSDFIYRLLGGQVIQAPLNAGDVMPDLALVKHWIRLLQMSDAWSRRAGEMEVQARLIRLAHESKSNHRPTSSKKHPMITSDKTRHFLRIMRLLSQRCSEPWTAQTVGDEVGLHPNYAMRLFREASGATIRATLNQQRVAMAQRLLCTTDMKVIDIGCECGFQSQASFYELFVRATGKPPAKYRQEYLLRSKSSPQS